MSDSSSFSDEDPLQPPYLNWGLQTWEQRRREWNSPSKTLSTTSPVSKKQTPSSNTYSIGKGKGSNNSLSQYSDNIYEEILNSNVSFKKNVPLSVAVAILVEKWESNPTL